ncbi:DUF6308 family protein [Micromonospora sp. CA-111912]|uniref:DUF6308 family protein n=1 Tax=Micromonospora sp. CA-111912 TaxID=3239955 RepID=UPI003D8D2561
MGRPLTLAEILAVLDDPRTTRDLQRYFGAAGQPPYTGAYFERLGGGGDRVDLANVITADDLVAIELLSVRIPAQTALDLLQGEHGQQLSAELAAIPCDVDLGDEEALPLIVPGGHADIAWRSLKGLTGIEWVIASKLLARKRPALVPVYDGVVSCAFGTGTKFWQWLHALLGADGGVLRQRLDEYQAKAGLPAQVSRLRILDVVFWMRHEGEHLKNGCPGLR